jgi:hypothetical protein
MERLGINTFYGLWSDMKCSDGFFTGIYLDLCTGSAGYAAQQLELATRRAAPGCIMAWTLTERNYEGEDLVLRQLQLIDLLGSRGWTPACEGMLRLSTLLHKSGGGQRVMTQVWRRAP